MKNAQNRLNTSMGLGYEKSEFNPWMTTENDFEDENENLLIPSPKPVYSTQFSPTEVSSKLQLKKPRIFVQNHNLFSPRVDNLFSPKRDF